MPINLYALLEVHTDKRSGCCSVLWSDCREFSSLWSLCVEWRHFSLICDMEAAGRHSLFNHSSRDCLFGHFISTLALILSELSGGLCTCWFIEVTSGKLANFPIRMTGEKCPIFSLINLLFSVMLCTLCLLLLDLMFCLHVVLCSFFINHQPWALT